VRSADSAIDQFIDDYCGTTWHPPWPVPGAGTLGVWTGLTAQSDRQLIAGRRAAQRGVGGRGSGRQQGCGRGLPWPLNRGNYGRRRVDAVIRRRCRENGDAAVDVKRVYRVMTAHGLLVERHYGSSAERRRQHYKRPAVFFRDARHGNAIVHCLRQHVHPALLTQLFSRAVDYD